MSAAIPEHTSLLPVVGEIDSKHEAKIEIFDLGLFSYIPQNLPRASTNAES